MENKKKRKHVERITCSKCNYTFSRKDNLKRHFLRHHKEEYVDEKVNKTFCLYPGCKKQFYHKSKMLEHLEQGHGVELQVEKLEFQSLEDFRLWKEEEEITKFVYFSKHTGSTRSSVSDISYYMCQKDGLDKTVQRKSSRRNKRGVTKTGHVCPARMIVNLSLETGHVSVRYTKSHNHVITPNDVEHHPIPRHEREQMRVKETMGVVSSRKAMKEYKEKRKATLNKTYKNLSCDDNNKRHFHGINIPDSDVTKIDDGWKIVSSRKEVHYVITKQNDVCDFDHCFSKCLDLLCLGLCGHLYYCTCEDNSKICKHIHKVHSILVSYKTLSTRSKDLQEQESECLSESIVETTVESVVESEPKPVDYMPIMNGQLDLIHELLHGGSVHELLYPHITEMLQQVVLQCKVELTFSTDE